MESTAKRYPGTVRLIQELLRDPKLAFPKLKQQEH